MSAEPQLVELPEPRPVDLARLGEQLRSDARRLRSLPMSAEDLIGIAGRLDAIADALGTSHG